MDTKKPKMKIKIMNLSFVICVFFCILYLSSCVFLKGYNISLASDIADKQEKIIQIKAEIDNVTIQIKDLTDYSRVMDTMDAKTSTAKSVVVISD